MSSQDSSTSPDFTRLARRATERLAVVQFVLQTEGLQETDYLEWKTGYDLSKNSGAAATGKHLVGFANRDFAQAARHADGYAYLLLGVEPGNLAAVPTWDSARIEDWLVRFVGRDLRYDMHYVEVGGKQVLFLTVDPPKQGDPIYCLQQSSGEPGSGKTLPEGSVYVRHGGQTDVADAPDIARLTARARAVVSTLALRVELDTSAVAVIGERVLSDAERAAFVETERSRLYGTLPAKQAHDLSFAASGERRSRNEFRSEVEAYVDAMTSGWETIVVADHVEHERSKFVTIVVNDTDNNFEDVVLELTLPFDSRRVYARPRQAAARLKPPEAPDGWGKGLMSSLSRIQPVVARLSPPPEPEFEEPEKGVTLVRFPAVHVRPHTPHRLKPLLLALPPNLAGTTLPVRWRVTARNTPGQLEGEVEFDVPGLEQASDIGPSAVADWM